MLPSIRESLFDPVHRFRRVPIEVIELGGLERGALPRLRFTEMQLPASRSDGADLRLAVIRAVEIVELPARRWPGAKQRRRYIVAVDGAVRRNITACQPDRRGEQIHRAGCVETDRARGYSSRPSRQERLPESPLPGGELIAAEWSV